MQIGVVTQRNPDTVRAPDVVFLSRDRFGDVQLPDDYLASPPDAVFDVLDRHDRRIDVRCRVADYLRFGTDSVYVLDHDTRRVHCYYQDLPEEILNATDEFVGIGPLAGFRVPVAKFFE